MSSLSLDDVSDNKEVLQNNGSIVFSSAAATTLGKYTLPVYEIYKVGEPLGMKPMGLAALDMLRIEAGLIFAGYEFLLILLS